MPIRTSFRVFTAALLLPSVLLTVVGSGLGCNNKPNESIPVQTMKNVSPQDPRVVEIDGTLYTKGSEPTSQAPSNPLPSPGSGKPDESNGVCRLYAPLLPEPVCCRYNLGFDESVAREICGHAVYIGESFHYSCGYYFFHDPDVDQEPTEIRLSTLSGSSIKEIAKNHDTVMQRRLKDPKFQSKPIPKLKGGYWSHRDGLNWAFIPGWDKPRQVSWKDSFCPLDKMPKLLARIAAAPQPPLDTPATRTDLVPTFYDPKKASNAVSKTP